MSISLSSKVIPRRFLMDLTAGFIFMYLSIDLQVLDAAAVRLR